MGIRTIIDFRNRDEKQADPFDKIVEEMYPTLPFHQQPSSTERRRYHIPLMNLDFKLRGLFQLGTNAKTKLYAVVSLLIILYLTQLGI